VVLVARRHAGPLSRATQPLPVDVPARLVVRNQRLHELDRVAPDDLADRRSIRRGPFEQVGEVFEQRFCARGNHQAPAVIQVPLERGDRRAVVLGKLEIIGA
jgi:hypothetical protein